MRLSEKFNEAYNKNLLYRSEFMTRLETIQRIALRLAERPLFCDTLPTGFPSNYAVYASVPMGAILRSGTPAMEFDPELCVDLLVCDGTQVRIAVMFDADDEMVHRFFGAGAPLCGISLCRLPLHIRIPLIYEDLEARLGAARRVADGWRSPFSLNTAVLLKTLPPLQYKQLAAQSLLTDGGVITPAGRAAGIFLRVEWNGSAALSQPCVSPLELPRLWTHLFPYPTECTGDLVPLAQRLRRLEQGLPSSNAASRQIAELTQQMLDAPLSTLTSVPGASVQQLQDDIRSAHTLMCRKKSVCKSQALPGTVLQALELACKLQEISRRDGVSRQEALTLQVSLMTRLGAMLLAPQQPCRQRSSRSLQRRLSESGARRPKFGLLALSLSLYFQGLCAYTRSTYPLFISNRILAGELNYHLQSSSARLHNPEEAIRFGIRLCQDPDPESQSEGLSLLYHLLATPLFPDYIE